MTIEDIEARRQLDEGIIATAWERVRPMLELDIPDAKRQAILNWYTQTINVTR